MDLEKEITIIQAHLKTQMELSCHILAKLNGTKYETEYKTAKVRLVLHTKELNKIIQLKKKD